MVRGPMMQLAMVQTDQSESQPLLSPAVTTLRSASGYLPDTNHSDDETQRSHVAYGSVAKSDVSLETVWQRSAVTLTWSAVNATVSKPTKAVSSLRSVCGMGGKSEERQILRSVYGMALPGTLTAIMGSSGSGKSTLMLALAARTDAQVAVAGSICYNGVPLHRSMLAMNGFVYQDDMFVGCMSVREHLVFVANMKLGRSMNKARIAARVDEVLEIVGLTGQQHTRIGTHATKKSLSGGEKKRLSFASEVLADPPLLFCDEPTTGLDSHNAECIVKTMKRLAAAGKTVVCTVHQPSSALFAMFDQLLLLAEGRVAYMGAAKTATAFFAGILHRCPAHYNPADFFIRRLAVVPGNELESRQQVALICSQFDQSESAKLVRSTIEQHGRLTESEAVKKQKQWTRDGLITNRQRIGWLGRFFCLTWRALKDSVRNPAVHWVRIVQKILMALVAGMCFSNMHVDQTGIQSIQGLLFILVTENTFPALYGVLSLFPKELPLFLREHKAGLYSTSEYYLSRIVSLVPGFIVDPVLFVAILYLFVPFATDSVSIVTMLLIAIATCNTAASCGCLFSAAFEDVPMAVALLIPFDYLLMITGGIFLRLSSMPHWLAWSKYMSWFKYANEAFSIVQWRNVTNIPCTDTDTTSVTNVTGLGCLTDGDQVLRQYTFQSDDLPSDLACLAALYVGFHTLALVALWSRTRRS